MIYDKKNLLITSLCVGIGLVLVTLIFLFGDKLIFNSPSISFFIANPEKLPKNLVPAEEIQTESEASTEINNDTLISKVRENDPSNDGWMIREWNGTYSNPKREFFYTNPPDPHLLDPSDCPKLNGDEPNSYVVFENNELSVRIPFNEKWGGDFKLTPFEFSNNSLQSGLLSGTGEGWDGESCQYLIRRGISLKLEPKQDLKDYLARLRSEDIYNEISDLRLIEIPSLKDKSVKFTALEYGVAGLGWNLYLVLFGNENIYDFNFPDGNFDALEDIVSTIELK
ncbi:MAG TPA: hypothetical protein PK295_01240 [Candidatus Magasanikbacteria bacterium]|nr:hypothetical protein [Candidatus Magasanikbacteria bacterium]